MARTFRRQRQAQPIADLNVTNLIDLGFTLLIIFMIATPLINQEQTMPVNLPVASKTPPPKASKEEAFQVVSIDARGRFLWGMQPVSLAELGGRLDSVAARKPQPVIRIRADGSVPYQKVITLMDELQKRGLSRINFDNQAEQ